MTDVPFEDPSDELWGVPDFEGPVRDQPLPDWFSRSKSLLPACRHWREPVVLVDEVVVFASAWFDRPMTARGVDMSWPDVGFYLDGSWSAAVLVCSPGFRPPFAQRPKGQFVVYPWPDLGAPRDPRREDQAARDSLGCSPVRCEGCSDKPRKGAELRSAAPGATAAPGPRSQDSSSCRDCRRGPRSVGSGGPIARRPSNHASRKPSCATSLLEPADRWFVVVI